MPTYSTLIFNPTSSPITIDATTVDPGKTATVALSDATTDAYAWIDAGAVLTSGTTPGKVPCEVCQYPTTPGAVLKPSYLP